MSSINSLAKQRAAMVVGDFDFTNNNQPLTALPAILQALNATYTRNSLKNVLQNGALVQLAANQFGTEYDPVTGLYGNLPEPAATNLATNSDGNLATYTTASNVANGTAVPGFTNGIAFGDNSVARTAYKTVTLASATAYNISFFVIMDDGGAPVVGTSSVLGDFSFVMNGNLVANAALVRLIGSNVYRVSASYTTVNTDGRIGCIKYTTQSARTFRITGIQVETGLRATSYIATAGSTVARAADVLTVPLWINNLKDSQDGGTANWTRTNCTCVTSGTAPDGSATAQLVTVSSTAVTSFSNVTSLSPAGISVGLTASVYVKQGNQATCKVLLRNTTNATSFTTGTLTFATGIIAGTGWTVVDAGGGWFRCIYKTTTSGDSITVGHTMRLYVGFEGGSYASGDTVYAWGAQIEPGSVATAYRPTTSTLEYSRNLASFSDGNAATYTVSNVTDGTAVPSFTNGLAFGDNSVDRTAFKTITLTLGATYTVSVYVIMDDLGVPVAGASYVAGDFRLTVDGYGTGAGTAVHVGNNVYRVSASFTVLTGGARNCGLGKYTGQSARTFRVTGIQVERGSTLTTYEPTNTLTPSANANITGYCSAGYTLAVDQRMDTTLNASVDAIELSSFSAVDRVLIYAGGGTGALAAMTTNSVSVTAISGSTLNLIRKKYAGSYTTNNVMLATAGVAAVPDTSAPMPTGLLFLHIATAFNFTLQYNGFIFNTKLITQALTQAQLNGLTT